MNSAMLSTDSALFFSGLKVDNPLPTPFFWRGIADITDT